MTSASLGQQCAFPVLSRLRRVGRTPGDGPRSLSGRPWWDGHATDSAGGAGMRFGG
jgi:hypothetical protein